ncbi:hypothetical protein [Arthrobacter globiformis]|nr:hypothetical protein [Arthrobacter globiformis]MDQ0617084.1 hypothetical protein [Arthrobacter globiformis]
MPSAGQVGLRRLVHSQDEYDFAVTGNVHFEREARASEALTC